MTSVMRHDQTDEPDHDGRPDRLTLRAVQIVLVMLLVSLACAGRSARYWPIKTWPVYSKRTSAMPPDRATTIEARVLTADGRTHRVGPEGLVEFSRHNTALRTMWGAVNASDPDVRRAYRRHLTTLLAARLGGDRFDAVELWRVEWETRPTQTPAIDRDRPVASELVARFDADRGGGER